MSSAKHFINDPAKVVAAALKSAPILNPTVGVDEVNKIVYRKYYDGDSSKKVSLLSGGGAGHEPSFTSFVGAGMLDAAVSGTIFASPSPSQIFKALKDLDWRAKKRGVETHSILMILMNYTGDVMNFGLAAEKANAVGLKVDMVVVADDVSVGREKGGKVGRRGIAGTVLVHKIAGAMAEEGYSHDEIKRTAERVAANLVSIGASLEHVHVPGHDASEESLGKDEIEIGMGIHNEQGCKKMVYRDLPEVVELLLGQMLNKDDKDRGFLGELKKGDDYALMVNNLGGVSPLEMGGITTEVVEQLKNKHGITPKRVYCGTLMTSLNGNGFSISLLRLAKLSMGDLLIFLDAKTETVVSPSSMTYDLWAQKNKPDIADTVDEANITESYKKSGLKMDLKLFTKVVTSGLKELISAEKEITKYDEQVGDGDCGIGLKRGADAVLALLESGSLSNDAAIALQKIAEAIERSMDGTSGAIYCIFFNAFSLALRRGANDRQEHTVTAHDWAQAALSAQQSLSKYTPARPGDRTLVDALHPFIQTLGDTDGDLKAAAQAARQGAERTKGMKPKLGRTVYVGNIGSVPDPGAVGVAKLVEGLQKGLEK